MKMNMNINAFIVHYFLLYNMIKKILIITSIILFFFICSNQVYAVSAECAKKGKHYTCENPSRQNQTCVGALGCTDGNQCCIDNKWLEATACRDKGGPTANCYKDCDGKETVPNGDVGCKNENGKKCCKPLSGASADTNSGILPLETGGTCSPGENCGNYSLNDFVQLAVEVSDFILGIVGSLALLAFVYGGIVFLISGGSSEKVEKGKQILLGAVIGLVVVFLSYTIIQFTLDALGVQQKNSWSQTGWF